MEATSESNADAAMNPANPKFIFAEPQKQIKNFTDMVSLLVLKRMFKLKVFL